jgi:hypothetical protein
MLCHMHKTYFGTCINAYLNDIGYMIWGIFLDIFSYEIYVVEPILMMISESNNDRLFLMMYQYQRQK